MSPGFYFFIMLMRFLPIVFLFTNLADLAGWQMGPALYCAIALSGLLLLLDYGLTALSPQQHKNFANTISLILLYASMLPALLMPMILTNDIACMTLESPFPYLFAVPLVLFVGLKIYQWATKIQGVDDDARPSEDGFNVVNDTAGFP